MRGGRGIVRVAAACLLAGVATVASASTAPPAGETVARTPLARLAVAEGYSPPVEATASAIDPGPVAAPSADALSRADAAAIPLASATPAIPATGDTLRSPVSPAVTPSPVAPAAAATPRPVPTAVPHPAVTPPPVRTPAPPPPAPSPRPAPTPAPIPAPTPAPPSGGPPPNLFSQAQVIAIIQSAALANGLDPTRLVGLARCESSLNPSAQNPTGPYDGLFQFWPPTFAAHGGTDIWNPVQQSAVAATMIAAGQASAWACPY